MSAADTSKPWTDPDDAPEWSDEAFERAELSVGGEVVREASGTLKRGRPKSANPKLLVTLRLDSEVIEHFKGDGPGWQSRIKDARTQAVGA